MQQIENGEHICLGKINLNQWKDYKTSVAIKQEFTITLCGGPQIWVQLVSVGPGGIPSFSISK